MSQQYQQQALYPSRPKNTWSVKDPPWTDGRGSTEDYHRAVRDWTSFMNLLPDGHPQKLDPKVQGLILKSQLFGRARDIADQVSDKILHSVDGALAIANAVHRYDPLSALTNSYSATMAVINCKRASNELYSNFVNRFEAEMSVAASKSGGMKLPPAFYSFLLLNNSGLDETFKITIISSLSTKVSNAETENGQGGLFGSAATPGYEIRSPNATNADVSSSIERTLSCITFEDVASIIRSCDQALQMRGIRGSSANVGHGNSKSKACFDCGKVGHYKGSPVCPKFDPNYHKDVKKDDKDGESKSDNDHTGKTSEDKKKTDAKKKTLTFNHARLVSSVANWSPSVSFISSWVFYVMAWFLYVFLSCIALKALLPSRLFETKSSVVGNNASLYSSSVCDPLVDDGAMYSGLGECELDVLLGGRHWNQLIEPLPKSVEKTPYWSYGPPGHSSEPRKLVGSIMLSLTNERGEAIEIRHLVIQGRSQWVLGGNVLSHCNNMHLDNKLLFQNGYCIPTYAKSNLCYVSASLFSVDGFSLRNSSSTQSDVELSKQLKIVDRIHNYVCGHSSVSDMKTLLQRNKIWSSAVEAYLHQVTDSCAACHCVQPPSPMRKVSITSLNRSFNDSALIDHLFIEQKAVVHVMEASCRYSSGAPVASTSVSLAINFVEERYFSEFWVPGSMKFDSAFNNDIFKRWCYENDIIPEPIPARRHNKLALESKHKILRDIFIKLREANPDARFSLLVARMFDISNILYGNGYVSAYESAKGYSKPILPGGSPVVVPEELVKAQEDFIAKRKLNLILKSKNVKDININIGQLVDVFVHTGKEKRGNWLLQKRVISFDRSSGIVTVPGMHGKVLKCAIEDCRHSVETPFAYEIQHTLDELDEEQERIISEEIESENEVTVTNDLPFETNISSDSEENLGTNANNDHVDDFSTTNTMVTGVSFSDTIGEKASASVPSYDESQTESELDLSISEENSHDSIMEMLEASNINVHDENLSELADNFASMVAHDRSNTGMQREVSYLDKNNILEGRTRSSNASLIDQISPGSKLDSVSQDTLKKYFDRFGSKEFNRKSAEGLPSFVLDNAYDEEKENFSAIVKPIVASTLKSSNKRPNIISSHCLYKIKTLDDGSLKCKCRIAPHGNEDDEQDNLRTDSASVTPMAFRIFLSICSLKKFFITKVDFKAAFLQTGPAQRDVYVRPPRENGTKFLLWLLTVASYGLKNGNAKWQNQSDELLTKNCNLIQVPIVPQLFYRTESGELKVILIKLVDDLLIGACAETRKTLVEIMRSKFEIGTLSHTPGKLLFFGAQVEQSIDGSITISAEDKVSEVCIPVVTRERRKESTKKVTADELKVFRSINGKFSWLGMLISPVAAFISSTLQQRSHSALVQDLVDQHKALKTLQKVGAKLVFQRPIAGSTEKISVISFTDAARPNEKAQLGHLSGLIIGKVKAGSLFHLVSWASCLSGSPVKSSGSGETFAAGAGSDNGKQLAMVYSLLLGVEVELVLVTDSKSIWDSISTCHEPSDRTIRPHIALLRYDFERKLINTIVWVKGILNPADVLTKHNSPAFGIFCEMVDSGKLVVDLDENDFRSPGKSLG